MTYIVQNRLPFLPSKHKSRSGGSNDDMHDAELRCVPYKESDSSSCASRQSSRMICKSDWTGTPENRELVKHNMRNSTKSLVVQQDKAEMYKGGVGIVRSFQKKCFPTASWTKKTESIGQCKNGKCTRGWWLSRCETIECPGFRVSLSPNATCSHKCRHCKRPFPPAQFIPTDDTA